MFKFDILVKSTYHRCFNKINYLRRFGKKKRGTLDICIKVTIIYILIKRIYDKHFGKIIYLRHFSKIDPHEAFE